MSDGGCFGSALSKPPGIRKEAGDTLLEALMPPHPALSKSITGTVIYRICFQFIFTTEYFIVFICMLAISNSWGTKPNKPLRFRGKFNFSAVVKAGWLAAALVLYMTACLEADAASPESQAGIAKLAQHAEKAYAAAKTRFETETNNPEAAWQFGRACYDWADFATSDGQRADIAKQGIAACRSLIERDSGSAPGHYYLAMNLGQLAQTKSLGALKIVGQMEGEFKLALNLDPKLDFAGPDRGLGLLYLEAPGWPASIGSKTKARQHLQKALIMFPDFPENVLNMIEAEVKWGDKRGAVRDLAALEELWPTARMKFAGDQWASSWADWEKRRGLAEKKVAGTRKTPAPPR